MMNINNEVINSLDMIQLRELYRGVCGDKLASWIKIGEARNIVTARIITMNKIKKDSTIK